MKIKLSNEKSAADEAFQGLQVALGCKLSDSFRDFVNTHDGATPETNIFRVSGNNESGVNRFIPVSEILKERARIDNIPKRAYPIAWAEGGNYVFIDEDENGAVFFWDHEASENIVQIASGLATFLDLLEPFDIKTVELQPGQVKKVWVDPDFLKRLKMKHSNPKENT